MFSKDQIYSDDDMDKLIKRNNDREHDKKSGLKGPKYGSPYEQPRIAIQRMRSLVGGYIYMNDKRVNTIFVNQVNRIGQKLENLEQALPKNPRKVTRGRKGGPDHRVVTYDPWKYLDLEKKWYKYMDDIYDRANKKGQEFMNTNLKRLKEEYNDGKMLKQSEIDKEKDPKRRADLKAEKELREAMKVYIDKLDKEWSKWKNWPKPEWNT